jgi:hypothetical protein
MTWYNRVINNLAEIPNFIDYYEGELQQAKKEVKVYGNIEKNVASLPGITEQYFSQLQEIEAILSFLEVEQKRLKRQYFQKYFENYNRALSSRDAERYADGEEEVVNYAKIIIEVSLLRNKYLGIIKGLESKSFMLGHLCRLRTAGMEDFTIG